VLEEIIPKLLFKGVEEFRKVEATIVPVETSQREEEIDQVDSRNDNLCVT